MEEKEKVHQTEHRKYPKPKQEHLLQVDVKNLEKALDMIDDDVREITDTQDSIRKEKADQKTTDEAVKTLKAGQTDLNTEVGKVQKSLETKAVKADVDKTTKEILQKLESRAVKTDVEASLRNVNQSIDKKANIGETQLLPGTHPFLYCRIRRSGKGYLGYPWTSQYQLYNNTRVAPFFMGHFGGWTNNGSCDAYAIPPGLYFSGNGGAWLKSDGWLEYTYTSHQYCYPSYDVMVLFIKNKTNANQYRTFYRYLSSNSRNGGYNYSSVYLGTPNNTNQNKSRINSISWSTLYNYGGRTYATSAAFNVTVPANKTVSLIFYSTPYFYSNTCNHYSFYSTIGFYNLHSFLSNVLEIDHERTMKVYQRKCKNINEIWH